MVCEKWFGQQVNWNNIPLKTVNEYWQRSVCLLSLNIAFAEIKPRSAKKRRAHYELYVLIFEHGQKKINMSSQCLKEKWDYAMPLPVYFHR